MLKRLHVALVYNLKKEGAGEVSGDCGERDDAEGNTLVVQRTKLQKTKADTYAEWDTEETILAVRTALEHRYDVSLIEANEAAYHNLLSLQPDIVFNIAEGLRGASREAQIPALLEMLGIPYTGSDPVTLGICLDKARTKEILAYHRIPTPAFKVVSSLGTLLTDEISYPSIVKPLHEGSSKGIVNASVVANTSELEEQVRRVLEEYDEPALVEDFLTGREFTVALIGNGEKVRTLPIVEIRFDGLPGHVNPIYSYEAKWIWDTVEHPIEVHQCPANIEPGLERTIVEVSRKAFIALGCRDWCRIDIRLDGKGIPNVMELNPLPGILPNPEEHSCFPQAARAAGMSYDNMILSVVQAALERTGSPQLMKM